MDFDTLTINNGTFLNSSQYAVQNWNVATINGGTFESKTMSAVINGVFNKFALGTLTVTGGTFTPAEGYADVTIDGQTFARMMMPKLNKEYRRNGIKLQEV